MTGEDAEYLVTYFKLFFAGCILFELKIKNTVPDTTLLDITAELKF